MEKQNLYSDINVWNLSDSSLVADGDSVYQSAQIILSTPKGARFFRPEFGVTVHSNLFELLDDQMEMRLRSEIISALPRHDPRIKIDQRKTNVRRVPEEHRLDVDVSFNIKGLDDKFEYQGNFDDSFPALVPPVCRPFQPIPPTEPAPLIGEIGKPLVTLTPTPNSGWAPLSTVFRIEVLHDIAVKWSLSFGDGKPAISSNRNLKDGYVDVPHIYTDDGAYRATLTWTNQLGEEKTLRAIVTVATLRCSAYLPLTVLLESGDVETKNFLLSPAKIPNATTEAPLSIDGSWDGTKINLVTAPTLPPNAIEGVELLDFWADGLLTKAWVIEDLDACEDTAKDPGCGGPSSDEKVTGQRLPVGYTPPVPVKKVLDWRTGYINASNNEDVIWELDFSNSSNLPTLPDFSFFSQNNQGGGPAAPTWNWFGLTLRSTTSVSFVSVDTETLASNGLNFNSRTKTITGKIKSNVSFSFDVSLTATFPAWEANSVDLKNYHTSRGMVFPSGPETGSAPITSKTETYTVTFRVESSINGSLIPSSTPMLSANSIQRGNTHINFLKGEAVNIPINFNSTFSSTAAPITILPTPITPFVWTPQRWGVRTDMKRIQHISDAGRDVDVAAALRLHARGTLNAQGQGYAVTPEFTASTFSQTEISGDVGKLPRGLNYIPGENGTGRLYGRVAPEAVNGFFYVEVVSETWGARLQDCVKITYTVK